MIGTSPQALQPVSEGPHSTRNNIVSYTSRMDDRCEMYPLRYTNYFMRLSEVAALHSATGLCLAQFAGLHDSPIPRAPSTASRARYMTETFE